MAILSTFFSGNIGQVNVFYDILEGQNAFLNYKNEKFNGSGPKMAIFANFSF